MQNRIAVKLGLPLLLLGAACGVAFGGNEQLARQKSPSVAFTGVNVIPMDRERVLKNQTVIVRDSRIASIGDAAKVKVPAGALRIDGRGKYLIPGLVDMHTHLFSDDAFPDTLASDELAVMLANGVTTIRLMIGTPEHLALRAKIAKGELLGPALYVASPQVAGKPYGSCGRR
ncbi:MAG TPA: hypothetical protein VM943_01595 [Pyrinomonadaceae bacterium]|nr:hypothetical protein [Pyrinomonadaceae bacterium]